MKIILKYIAPAVAAVCAMAACEKEISAPEVQDGPEYIITASMNDELTKAVIRDGESIKWAAGDEVKLAAKEGVSPEFTVEEETTTLTLTATGLTAGSDFVLLKTNHGNKAFDNVEVRFPAEQTQAEAGILNSENIVLHSDVAKIPAVAEGEQSVAIPVKMKIIGSLYRFIPYTNKYNDEKIVSVSFVSADKNIAGNGAVIGKNYNTPNLYKQNTDGIFGEECVIFWDATSKEVKTTLTTPYDLADAKSSETTKGIYMSLAPIKMSGYKYVVRTDKATYTFDASDKPLQIAENGLKNVLLNLDNEKVIRVADSGKVRYEGNIKNYDISYEAIDNQTTYMWNYAMVQRLGSENYEKVPNTGENIRFYTNVVFEYTDAKTGDKVDWLSVKYGENSDQWHLTVSENTGDSPRSAKVTARYANVGDYVIENPTCEMVVTQRNKSDEHVIVEASNGLNHEHSISSSAQKFNAGYLKFKIDNRETANDWTGTYSKTVFNCVSNKDDLSSTVDWISSVEYLGYNKDAGTMQDCIWVVSVTENQSAETREAYIVLTFVEDEHYTYPENQSNYWVHIVQKGNLNATATITGVDSEKIVSADGETIAAGLLTLVVNGSSVSDVATAMTQYGIAAKASVGTVSVDAAGNISLTVPKNFSAKERVITLNVATDNKVLTTQTYTQAAGTGEGACAYTYDLVFHNDGRLWGASAGLSKHGHFVTINQIKLNGESVTLTDEIVGEITAFAIRYEAPSEQDYTDFNIPADRKASATAVQYEMTGYEAANGLIRYGLTTDTESFQATKIYGYNSDGTVKYTQVIFMP